MGAYINPRHESKEAFLAQHGYHLSRQHAYNDGKLFLGDKMLVCLVDNGAFTAGLVVASEYDHVCAFDESDDRPVVYYLVETAALHLVCEDLKVYLRQEESKFGKFIRGLPDQRPP